MWKKYFFPLIVFVFVSNSFADDDADTDDGQRSGQNLGGNVTCNRWTARLITVSPTSGISYIWADKDYIQKRCTVDIKAVDGCTEIALSCSKFYVPNEDPIDCSTQEGSVVFTKADMTRPRAFCRRKGPNVNFPVLANDDIRFWYVGKYNYTSSFTCQVLCSQF